MDNTAPSAYSLKADGILLWLGSLEPTADGSNSGLKNGWIPWYTTTGFLVANGDPGVGDSYHITSRTDASVALQFYGMHPFIPFPLFSAFHFPLSAFPSPLCSASSCSNHSGSKNLTRLRYIGNSIYLYGTSNSSYAITLDSMTSAHAPPTKSESDLLFSATGLDVGTHSGACSLIRLRLRLC